MAWPNWSRRSSARLLAGFQGKDVVQITFREITDIKWLRRFGGAAGDLVLTLQDGAKVPPTPRRSPRRSPPTPQPTLQPTSQHMPQHTPQHMPAVAPAACMPPPLPRRAVYLALAAARRGPGLQVRVRSLLSYVYTYELSGGDPLHAGVRSQPQVHLRPG